MLPYPRTWVEIDLDALRHNLTLVRRSLDGGQGSATKIALVAKADAYGHGLVPVSRFALANGVDWIGVATVQEGVALRDAGIEAPIAVISPTLAVEAEQAVFYRLRVLVESLEAAVAIADAAREQGTEAIVHLEIDTGISRFGCDPSQAPDLACAIAALPHVRLEGASTHFANSGHDPELTRRQHQAFLRAVTAIRRRGIELEVLHAANSAAAARFADTRLDLVRVGVSAYGIDAYDLYPGESRSVLTWKARVTAIRSIPAGTSVSYAGTWRARRPTRVATLGVGYGDGYPRALSNRGVVFVGGKECPVIGLVNMDLTMIDVTDAPAARLGDVAVVAGGPIPCARLAALIDTTSHEITTRIMSRVPRRFAFPS